MMMIGSPIGLLSSAVLLALTFADCLLPVALDLEVRRINDDDRVAHFFLLCLIVPQVILLVKRKNCLPTNDLRSKILAMAKPRTCPHCREQLPIGGGYHFDEKDNLVCGFCGKIAFSVEEKPKTESPLCQSFPFPPRS